MANDRGKDAFDRAELDMNLFLLLSHHNQIF